MPATNNTITTYKTQDGQTLELTLCFANLYEVKTKYPEEYQRYNAIMMDGMSDVFDAVSIMYTAYLCVVCTKPAVVPHTYTEFMVLLGDDNTGVMATATRLLGRKKKANSVIPS